ncbi:TadE/TadG family type IV pilus assembly protein [Microbacterium sp.]|uniref:TadE/TadG family type IV pilus assembly protein n=1 Tax=Microbacterium sp. TaxID=51671 RepID=UPI00092A5A3B|nr:TadE/TadG family type IV pilus assembly protein [Microbacterium sp.]OJU57414.1 MAG: TadE family protein [Microbacterium sp. 70-38]
MASRLRRLLAEETGSSPVEFVLVGALLTLLTLGVLQLGLAIYVRNVVHDAAVEGAYHGALADTGAAEGIVRTREIITRAIGSDYASDVRARVVGPREHQSIEVTVHATLPLIGLLGAPNAWEVTARAPVETLD